MERDARQIHDDKPISAGSIVIGVIIGRTGEFFDFFVYGLASVLVFPRLVFSFAGDPVTATLYSFAVFSLAFLARPVGSVVFMWIDSRYGRGTKLTIALFLLGGSTASIAFLPGYESIGMWSPALLALFRLGQGFALGGAWDGLASLLALNAPENRRGFYAMVPQLGAPFGFALASTLFGYFAVNLTDADFLSWGWRYPFFVAFAINVVALFARLRIVASREFGDALANHELEPTPIPEVLRVHGAISCLALSCRWQASPCSIWSRSSRSAGLRFAAASPPAAFCSSRCWVLLWALEPSCCPACLPTGLGVAASC
jgi:MFS family permease